MKYKSRLDKNKYLEAAHLKAKKFSDSHREYNIIYLHFLRKSKQDIYTKTFTEGTSEEEQAKLVVYLDDVKQEINDVIKEGERND